MYNLKQEFPPITNEAVDERTKKAIGLFKKIVIEASDKKWKYVVLSGFAIDAYLGYISRNHKDVDFIIDKKNITEVKEFLEKEGHSVFRSKTLGEDDVLKIDPIDAKTQRAAHCDIHISFFDEKKKEVVIPMHGNEIRFSGNYNDISTEKEFLGVKASILLPDLLIEEKKGWTEKIGLSARPEREEKNALEIKKIRQIINCLNKI